jgi:hypothetical protein
MPNKLIIKNSLGTTTGTWPVKSITSLENFDFSVGGLQPDFYTGPFALSPITIPAAELNAGDYFYYVFSYYSDYSPGGDNGRDFRDVDIFGGSINIAQYPNPITPITPGTNNIWGYYNTGSYPYVITSSNTELCAFYGNPDIKQKDIPGSRFNPVKLPWSIKYADDFRFEGREDYAYQVFRVFGPSDNSPGRLSNTGSIEVHFDRNLPISASVTVFNLDHFLIRRYVDDASQIIMKGFRPQNTTGPYIISPEYVTDSLNKNADTFINDLTERGLL